MVFNFLIDNFTVTSLRFFYIVNYIILVLLITSPSLKVDYEEKQFAQCVIPNTYMRREGAPKERELLCGRLIDRPIRPLFPPGFYHEVQVRFVVFTFPLFEDLLTNSFIDNFDPYFRYL